MRPRAREAGKRTPGSRHSMGKGPVAGPVMGTPGLGGGARHRRWGRRRQRLRALGGHFWVLLLSGEYGEISEGLSGTKT